MSHQGYFGRCQYLLLAYIIVTNFLALESLAIADSTTSSSTGASSIADDTSKTRNSIPRSSDRRGSPAYGSDGTSTILPRRFPPWTPSPNLDENGFLIEKYQRVPGEWEKEVKLRHRDQIPVPTCYHRINHNPQQQFHDSQSSLSSPSAANPAMVTIRQVPGDGNCLFHSISICHAHAQNGTHLDMRSPESMEWLYEYSNKLRQLAVDCLEDRRKLLFLQGHEYLRATELVEAAASQYDISYREYCDFMRKDSYWGGGPEIVALCNVLQRPIHVYELHVPTAAELRQQQQHRARGGNFLSRRRPARVESQPSSSLESPGFVVRRMACFGSPKFDRYPALHILSADSRFPDIAPGKQLPSGNHFLAIFPDPPPANQRRSVEEDEEEERKQRIRGGYVKDDGDDHHVTNSDRHHQLRQSNFREKRGVAWWRRFWVWED